MVKKVEEKTEDEIKEKDAEVEKEDGVIKKEDETKETEEVKKEVETPTVETEVAKEIELENDPWSAENWKSSFPELFEAEVVEKAEGLSKEDVVRICREQIKIWLKKTSDGTYPLPKSMTPTEQKSLNKIEDIEGLSEQFEKSASAYKSYEEKFNDIAKTFEEIRKEVQIIKDTPVDLIEKDMKDKSTKKYISPYETLKDGTITKPK